MPEFGNGTVQFTSNLSGFNDLILERIKKVVYCFIALLFVAGFYLMDVSFFRIISNFFKLIIHKKKVQNSDQNNKTLFSQSFS